VSQPPAAALDNGHPRKWLILSAVSLGMFMALLDVTIVNIAVPAIMDPGKGGWAGITPAKISWVLNAYNLAMAALFLSMGRIADKIGQKIVFVGGLVLFALFSLACGLAPSIEWLIVFRVVQGIGAAAMAPISLSILMGAFPQRQHGTAVGIWGALGTIAAALGPSIGGLLVTYMSWHWIFFINVPIGVGAFVFAMAVVPEVRRAGAAGGIDLAGILLSTGGLFCLTLGLTQGNDWGWSSTRVLILFGVAVACYPIFFWWETHTEHPMFDFRLLRIRSFTAANTAMLLMGAALGGTMVLLVIFMVNVMGYSELRAALGITFMPVTALFIAPNAGRLIDRIGPRFPAAIGMGFFSVGLVLIARLGGEAKLLDVAWRLVIMGIGMGFSMPTLAAAAMGSLPPRFGGVGSGAFATLRQVGFVLGVAILIAVFTHTIAQDLQAGFRHAESYVLVAPELNQAPPGTRDQIIAKLTTAAKQAAAQKGGIGGQKLTSADIQLPAPAAGTPPDVAAQIAQNQAQLKARLFAIIKDNVAHAFMWPFYVAALAAFLGIFPGLLTGRRLGEHSGHEEMSRSDRLAAGDEGA
jgi:EmrB/QacA subfamily drug resistance transporter